MSDFRPQATPRPLFELDKDHLRGLKTTTDNNQPLMALKYVYSLAESLTKRVAELEATVERLTTEAATEAKAVTRRAAKETPSES